MSSEHLRDKHPHMEIVIIPHEEISNIVVRFPRESYLSDRRTGGYFTLKSLSKEEYEYIRSVGKVIAYDRQDRKWVALRTKDGVRVLLKFEVMKRVRGAKPEVEWFLFDDKGNEILRTTSFDDIIPLIEKPRRK